MMAKLGFKAGNTLGASTNPNARVEPLGVIVKEDRGGIGLDSEKKRKFREEAEGEAKRVKAEEGEYRERVAREREERRLEGLIGGAMRVAERMDTETESGSPIASIESDLTGEQSADTKGKDIKRKSRPTNQINVLWRGLVRQREEKERERRMRYDLHQSLPRNVKHEDPEEDEHDRLAFGDEEEEVDEEDPELEEFNALKPPERLARLVGYLRESYSYCFWCKFRYPDPDMDGCPGLTEEDHD